jgi:hypothetical protein
MYDLIEAEETFIGNTVRAQRYAPSAVHLLERQPGVSKCIVL